MKGIDQPSPKAPKIPTHNDFSDDLKSAVLKQVADMSVSQYISIRAVTDEIVRAIINIIGVHLR